MRRPSGTNCSSRQLSQGTRPRRITEVRTDRGILKDRRRPPGRVRRTSVATVEQEAEFKPKDVQDVATVLSHKAPRLHARLPESPGKLRTSQSRGFVTAVTTTVTELPQRCNELPQYWKIPRMDRVTTITLKRDRSYEYLRNPASFRAFLGVTVLPSTRPGPNSGARLRQALNHTGG